MDCCVLSLVASECDKAVVKLCEVPRAVKAGILRILVSGIMT